MRARGAHAWRWAFGASVAVVGVADAVVLELVKAYFGSGYNGFALHGLGARSAFFGIGAVLDAAAISAAWFVGIACARLLRARPLVALGAATLLGVAIPLAFDLAIHRLHRVLGDVLELRLLIDLAAGSWGSAIGEASQDLPPLALLGSGAAVAIAAAWLAIARIERASPALGAARLPSLRTLGVASLACGAVGALALAVSATAAPVLEFGWGAKPSGRAIRGLVSALSDFDRDGYGWLSQPRDAEPFDARIHPYAIDVPGNGLDEDGVAGDLPAGVAVPRPLGVPVARERAGAPSVVLIFLESFRADVLNARLDGREVTPNLNRLAASGTLSTAYAHSPVTWASRGSLLQGAVVPTADGATLVDDFRARGYEVAWFSGQHDGVAEGRARLGTERASHFSDARDDVALRTSRSAQPISLQVSWKTVRGRVRDFLRARPNARPLFLYVNVVDTHFPYWHRELDDILGTGALARSEIRPENRDRVWRAYLNAAANVDRAIGEIAALSRAALGEDTLLVITGDHGQAFYESGMLGHGQALDDEQTAVPLVIGRRGVALPAPVALSDLRGAIGHCVDGTSVVASELARSEIFQNLGEIAEPREVALRSRDGALTASPSEGASNPEAVRALRVWETLNLEQHKREAAPAPSHGADAAR